jgi:Mor family transcriptional regulator
MVAIACKRFGVTESDSGHIANVAVQMIVAEYGGTRPYIPMLEVAKRVRNEAIVENLKTGRSLTWCSAKFRISKGRVRQIWRMHVDAVQRIGAEPAPLRP